MSGQELEILTPPDLKTFELESPFSEVYIGPYGYSFSLHNKQRLIRVSLFELDGILNLTYIPDCEKDLKYVEISEFGLVLGHGGIDREEFIRTASLAQLGLHYAQEGLLSLDYYNRVTVDPCVVKDIYSIESRLEEMRYWNDMLGEKICLVNNL